jgi:hypothetical protein
MDMESIGRRKEGTQVHVHVMAMMIIIEMINGDDGWVRIWVQSISMRWSAVQMCVMFEICTCAP